MTTFSDIAAIYRAKREVWLERGREAKSKAGKAGRALQLGHPHVRVPKKGQNDARVLG
jgi:hypothetical protein